MLEPSVIHALSMEGSALDPDPSVISTPSVDGSALDSAPSMKSTSTVDGSTPGIRTIRDSCPERGRFRSGPRTFHEIDLHCGRFAPLIPEPSVIQAFSVDGSALGPEPSVISTSSVDGSPPDA